MAKSDKVYYDNFAECTELASKASRYLAECLGKYDVSDIEKMLEDMHVFENKADINKHKMNEMLARAFVTPVEREDLDLLSQQLDTVLDLIEEVLQKIYIYGINVIETYAIDYAKQLVKACDLLCDIMYEFSDFKRSKKLHSLIIAVNDVEEECDKLYLTSMRATTESSADVLAKISWYKIYDCFEACADACEHVSECVGSIVMKNS